MVSSFGLNGLAEAAIHVGLGCVRQTILRQLAARDDGIDQGEPPLVFALGSAAVTIAENFFEISAGIARQLKRRTILVIGAHDDNFKHVVPGNDMLVIKYVAYDKLFHRASVIIHQGGI